jgi:hypothetical protein
MEPVLRAGDEIVVVYGVRDGVAVGDLVVFERDGGSIVHRIIAIRRRAGQRQYLERGDASPSGTWIEPNRVVGIVLGRPGPTGVIPIESPLVRRCRARHSRLMLALLRVRRRAADGPIGRAVRTWGRRAARVLQAVLASAR